MEHKKKHFHLNKIAAVVAAFALVVGSAQVAYAHYNGPQKLDHSFQINREHGKIN